jgi:UDP-N-acetylmuramate--alanine ligase
MANVFSATRNVAVAGTSGKSTTTGMLGFVLDRLGVNPTILNGAEMIDFDSSFRAGGERAVFEADESDGLNDVVGLCSTEVAVLTNISLDHFELPELERIFGAFISRATGGVVLNADCPVSMKLRGLARQHITFAASGGAADITPRELGGPLAIRGEHNVANALATLGAVKLLGLDRAQAAEALRSFRGMRRRLELIGEASGIKVFDDFASNPGKIRATLETLRGEGTRLIVIFQPHGFQPTKMMLNGYIDTFAECLRKDDRLFVPAIYYAGGSANLVEGKVVELPSDISGRDIVTGVTARGINARYVENRVDVVRSVAETVHAGDVVVSMGSRDETLPEFARSLYDGLTDI